MSNYWIIGSDGRTYGPVDLPTMQRWIGEARVVATTQVSRSEGGPWTDATLLTELASAFGEGPALDEAPRPAASLPGGSTPPTSPQQTAVPTDWPPPAISVTQLVSGILNLIAAGTWLLTCFGVVLAAPLAILGVCELVAFSRSRTSAPPAYLESANRMAILDICTLLTLNVGSAICGVVILTQVPEARRRLQAG